MESAVSALWGFDGFAWSAAAGNDHVDGRVRLVGAVRIAMRPLKSG